LTGVRKVEQTIDTLTIRQDKAEMDIREIFEKVNDHSISQATVNEKLNSMLLALGELKGSLGALREIPSKRYEGIVMAILGAIIAVAIGYISSKFK
jgi:hypothetical protein